MNEKPIPSAEAITALAEAWHDRMREAYEPHERPPAWGLLTAVQQFEVKNLLLPLLTVAMPQLSSDVLQHAAFELQAAHSPEWTSRDAVGWLRHQAEAVLT